MARIRPSRRPASAATNISGTAASAIPTSVHGPYQFIVVLVDDDQRAWISDSIFGDFSGHADGERRGLDRIRALSDATLRFDLALGVRRRHAPKSCQKYKNQDRPSVNSGLLGVSCRVVNCLPAMTKMSATGRR